MLPRGNRLTSGDEIREVIKRGKRLTSPYFVFYFLPSETNRFAVVTGRVLGNAVVRNKVKRRITNCVRTQLSVIESPVVGVFRMNLKALDCEWRDLEASVKNTLGRLNS